MPKYTAMFKIFLILLNFYLYQACPDNCFCDNYEAHCTIINCASEFPSEEIDILTIRGGLCGVHREMLHDNSETKIILKDDFCYGIGNCK